MAGQLLGPLHADITQALAAGRSLRNQIFFSFRTAPRDHQPPTASSHQPPTATNRQPATVANRQRPPTANRQPLPTATNHQSPTTTTTNRHQTPITNHQLPPTTTNRHQPLVANCQLPPTMVEHMECPRAFLGTLCNGTLFFSLVRTALTGRHLSEKDKAERSHGGWGHQNTQQPNF